MRQADAPDVCQSIPLITYSPIQCCGPNSGSRPSSQRWIRQVDAPDLSESIPYYQPYTRPTAPVKYRKPTAPLKTARTIQIVPRT
eukprot:586351-Pyramimonas_sp.AAC.1